MAAAEIPGNAVPEINYCFPHYKWSFIMDSLFIFFIAVYKLAFFVAILLQPGKIIFTCKKTFLDAGTLLPGFWILDAFISAFLLPIS